MPPLPPPKGAKGATPFRLPGLLPVDTTASPSNTPTKAVEKSVPYILPHNRDDPVDYGDGSDDSDLSDLSDDDGPLPDTR